MRLTSRGPVALSIILVLAAVAGTSAGCGDDKPAEIAMTQRVLGVADLPDGYSVVPVPLSQLVDDNNTAIARAQKSRFEPESCRPSADAKFTSTLTEDNTALLVAAADSGATISEVVSSSVRDIDADRSASTGACAKVAVRTGQGSLPGASVVTTTREIGGRFGDTVRRSLILDQLQVTTYADAQSRSRRQLTAQLWVGDDDSSVRTVSLSIAGPVAAGELAITPLSDEAFLALIKAAVERAGS